MRTTRTIHRFAWPGTVCLVALLAFPLAGQEIRAILAAPLAEEPADGRAVMRLTLDEAKQRLLANNKLINLAGLNAHSKTFAIKAARADYFPKVIGADYYLHFQDNLGNVLTAPGRTISGPLGRPLLVFPPTTVDAAVLNQNSNFLTVMAVQPVTDLLKVRQGVKIAQADEQIAMAQRDKGIRDLVSGVEQLYWGLLSAQRLRAGATEGMNAAEMLAAKVKTLEVRTALQEGRQGVRQVETQIADLQEQLNGLLDLPLSTKLELIEPPMPALPVQSSEEAGERAVQASPEVREAQQTIAKAEAARAAGRLDYVPSIALVGGYLNQTGFSYMQQNIGFVGAVGTYTFVDWGKRRNVNRERNTMVTMAAVKLQQTEADVRQKGVKAFRELTDTADTLKLAREMAELRREAAKTAATPAALMTAARDRMLAEVDLVKADLAYRQAYVQLRSLIQTEP